jgi:hypothetical protein
MFGFSPFARTPFASLPKTGAPAVAALVGQQLDIFANAPTVVGIGNVNLFGQQATLLQASFRVDSAYRLTGAELQTFIASVATQAKATYTLLGQELVGYTGTIRTGIAVYLLTQVLTSLQNNVFAAADANTAITGEQLNTAIASVVAKASATGSITGEELQLFQNSLTFRSSYRLTGIQVLASIANLAAAADANTAITGEELQTFINSVRASAQATTIVPQQTLTMLQTTPSVIGTANVGIVGIQAIITLQDLLVWGIIPDGQTPNWADVNTVQAETWAAIATNPAATWVCITTDPEVNWTDIDTDQDDTWRPIIT